MINYIVGLVLIVTFIGYDVYLALDGVDGNTWSEIARNAAMSTPILPWAWGVLAGHFWHPDQHSIHVAVLLIVTGAVVTTGIALRHLGITPPLWAPLLPGFVAGWFLWPSN